MGFQLDLVSDAGTRTVTEIHGDSIEFVREHTAESDFKFSVAYDESLESEVFSECHLMLDGTHLFAGKVLKVSSRESTLTTTLSGIGAPAWELKSGAAQVTYSKRLAWKAFQDYLDNHAPLSGTVTQPTASTITDREVQNADTTAEFNDHLQSGDPAASDPWQVSSGSVEVLQTGFFSEGEDETSESGTVDSNVNAYSDGFALRLNSSGDQATWDFTTGYTIPEEHVGVAIRADNEDGASSYDVEFFLDGNKIDELTGDLVFGWKEEISDSGFSTSFSYDGGDLSAGTHTVKIAQNDSSWLDVDCVFLYDTRYTYNFDDTVDSDDHLSGPELYPDAVRVPFLQEGLPHRVAAIKINATLDDTSGGQALGWSIDGGATWTDTGNTSSIDDTVSTPSAEITPSVVLSRTDDTRTTATPTTGFNGQHLQDWQVLLDLETVGVIDETVTGNHLQNMQLIADRGGLRFLLNHDEAESNWTVEAFQDGDVTGTADWSTLERIRSVDVGDYANRVIMKGKKKADGTRIRKVVKDDAEITAFGRTITRTFTDPSLKTADAVESAAYTKLNNAITQDQLVGTIEIMPKPVAPGKTYTVSAWSADLSLERVTYRVGGGRTKGELKFSKPEGLGIELSRTDHRVEQARRRL